MPQTTRLFTRSVL